MGSNIILVPVHLDAYFAAEDTSARSRLADFRRLPYYDDDLGDINGNHPFLDKTILSEPFDKNNGQLKAGLHLHWALPDALTKGVTNNEEGFHAVPNRWLITCMNKAGTLVRRQWIVESDYLAPSGAQNSYNAISYPYPKVPGLGQPYRYLGRQLPFEKWKEDKKADRLPKLTALGYGEPSFASFYPNCHSVFGALDQDITKEADLRDLSYELIGWYDDPESDPTRLREVADLQGQFKWQATMEDNPDRMVCYAQVTCSPDDGGIQNPVKDSEIKVSIGNSGTEALSASLATALSGDKETIEEQLENLMLSDELAGSGLDYYHRFKEARHHRSFTPSFGSSLYTIAPVAENSFVPAQVTLPKSLFTQLNELNEASQNRDQITRQLARQRHLLYADWYKFILTAYPEEALRGQYPDIDLVKFRIEQDPIPEIKRLEEQEDLLDQRVKILKEKLSKALNEPGDDAIEEKLVQQYLLKDRDADLSKLRFQPEHAPEWIENAPFSNECLLLERQYVSYVAPESIQAVSMWVYLSPDQNDEASLFHSDEHSRDISKSNVSDFWSRFVINQEEQSVLRSISWTHLPKGTWTYLYLEFKNPVEKEEELFFYGHNNRTSLNGRLSGLRFFKEGLTESELAYDRNMLGHGQYELRQVPGPRFWEPKEPVVFLEGKAAQPSSRHGFDGIDHGDGLLACSAIKIAKDLPQGIDQLQTEVRNILEEGTEASLKIARTTWRHQPWHPLLMEWRVEVLPVAEGSNHAHESRLYDPDYIKTNFSLEEHEPEFSFTPEKEIASDVWSYQGRSMLTPYAHEVFRVKAAKELGQSKPQGQLILKGVNGNPGSEETDLEDFHQSINRAWAHLETTDGVSQALSGLNAAMLMHHRQLQPPLADPLGFEDHQAFTDEVAAALNNHTRWGCWPEGNFNPIRSGVLMLKKLHLIDNFGSVREVDTWENFTCSETMKLPVSDLVNSNSHSAWLWPRFIQPARLDFRWLDAEAQNLELNTHPGSSPILGWIVCNHMEGSLAFYDRNGEGLGLIRKQAIWRSLPGKDKAIPLENIDPHLQKVIDKLCSIEGSEDQPPAAATEAKQTYFDDFRRAIDEAVEFIEPESAVHDDGLTHLIGHPIAITRAMVDISLNHDPVIDHGWMAFHHYLEGGNRQTDDFEKVKVPVRIGEGDRLNDGVIGYWAEEEGQLGKAFHSVVKEAVSDQLQVSPELDHIRGYDPNEPGLWISPADAQKEITLLMDPRSKVHAVTGVLPVKSIDIPDKHFQEVLKRVSAARFGVRVLTEKDDVTLPLRHEAGFEWSWHQKKGYQWTEISEQGTVTLSEIMSTFDEGGTLWEELLAKQWLHQLSEYQALIVPTGEQKLVELAEPFKAKAAEIRQWLENHRLRAASADAGFQSTTTVKEGWLGINFKEV